MRNGDRKATIALLVAVATLGTACAEPARGPSILLFVFDTVRADALARADVAPESARLAREGVTFPRARANAPWTLPSHVSLFSGLRPSRHGVHWRSPALPDDLVLLAQRLRAAGYQTWGYSENPWITPAFGFDRGFDRFVVPGDANADPAAALARWLPERDPGRPLLVFVNVMDAHWPYAVRSPNRFLPPDFDDADAAAQTQWPPDLTCARGPEPQRANAILHGLYLGDVAAADAKLAALGAVLEDATRGQERGLLRVITADHGELFGEDHLVNHQFSVHEALLRVPLIVHGLADGATGEVPADVELVDVLPSLLTWSGLPVPDGLAGRRLPLPGAAPEPATSLAEYRDPGVAGERAQESRLAALTRAQAESFRHHCGPDDPVWGDQAALIDGSTKLVWRSGAAPRLYDLAADPQQQRDLAGERPERVRALVERLSGLWHDAPGAAPATPTLDPELERRLEALGYLGSD